MVVWLGATAATAEPYLALREGLTCAACHVNRTGGGGRTTYGSGYGRQSLPWRRVRDADKLFDGELAAHVRLGGDLRASYTGNLREAAPYIGEYRLAAANLYLSVDLVSDRLTLYVDERVAPGGAASREAFALVRAGRLGLYAKGGRLLPPFGLRLQDDDAATRRFTGFNFATSDTGVEVGLQGGEWSGSLSVTNGTSATTEADNGKQVSLTGGYVRGRWRLGVSGAHNDLPGRAERILAGLHGGWTLGPVGILAEYDVIGERVPGLAAVEGLAEHLELDGIPVRGVRLRAWGGRFDPDRDRTGDEREQAGIGADWTVVPGLQIRAYYRHQHGPASEPASRDDQAVAEVHLYF